MRVTVPVTGGSQALGVRAAQALGQLPVVRRYLPRSATLVFKNAVCGTQRNRLNNRQVVGWAVVALPANVCRLVVRALGAQVSYARALECDAVRLAVGISQAMGDQEGARCGS